MKIFTFLVFIGVFLAGPCIAQPIVRLGVLPGVNLSYSGINALIPVAVQYNKHELYFGPKINLSSTDWEGNSSWGINAGYIYILIQKGHWSSIINFDYQQLSAGTLANVLDIGNNHLHEMNACFGLKYTFGKNEKTGLAFYLGQGLFIEKYYNLYQGQMTTNTGFTNTIMLRFHYIFLDL